MIVLVRHFKEECNVSKHVSFEFRMRKLKGFKVLLVGCSEPNLKPTQECDVEVVAIVKLNMYI